MISVEPSSIPLLSKKAAERAKAVREKRVEKDKERREAVKKEIAVARGDKVEGTQPNSSESIAEGTSSGAQKTSDAAEAAVTEEAASKPDESPNADEANASVEAVPETSAAELADAADASTEASTEPAEGGKKQVDKGPKKTTDSLPDGVLPFTLPSFAAPFLFIPPYLEVSFNTCSAIYMRHPTIVSVPQKTNDYGSRAGPPYRTDIPSPYPAGGDMFAMAWEHYARTSPRTRSDIRRMKIEGLTGTHGFDSARAKDAYKTLRAIRRGKSGTTPQASSTFSQAVVHTKVSASSSAPSRP